MKIESSKPNQASKNIESKNKPETNFRSMFNPPENLSSQPTGGFAKVLEETRNQNTGDKDFLIIRESERASSKTETAEAKKDEEIGGNNPNQEKVEDENNQDDGKHQQSDEQDESPVLAFVNPQTPLKSVSETAVPAARLILHVADLERIVSLIRTQNLKNVEQVVIALKHSVLEGLQIKLTIDEQGVLKAEFLALNEQIKKQLDARKQEITQIFRERGVKLSNLQIRQGLEFASPLNDPENGSPSDKTSVSDTTNPMVDADDYSNQASYRV